MYRLLILTTILAGCMCCKPVDQRAQARQEIQMTDKAMNDMAAQSGFHAALLSYAADSLIKPEDGQLPVIGKQALEKAWSGNAGTKDISWQPTTIEASASGDLGYSFGNWTFVTGDTTYYGNYFTAWKKQADGKWKWTVDGGNTTPAPR